jgi:hypothetical protein
MWINRILLSEFVTVLIQFLANLSREMSEFVA